LEVGCAEATFLNQQQAENPSLLCVGSDVDVATLRVAKRDHPHLALVAARAEALPFGQGAFRAVVMLDVLEHVSDDRRAIQEIAWALAPGGSLVLTTPHRGLFCWLDVFNLKLQFPHLYRTFCRLTGEPGYSVRQYLPEQVSVPRAIDSLPEVIRLRKNELKHRHYSVPRLRQLLAEFRIERVRRTGLVVFPVMHIIGVFVSKAFKTHVQLLMDIAAFEDGICFGRLAYNVALCAVKRPRVE
jgi:SAM-dependent methyltransferase